VSVILVSSWLFIILLVLFTFFRQYRVLSRLQSAIGHPLIV